MQYQINRCTAPCVGLVSKVDYALQVEQALGMLKGQDSQIKNNLISKMRLASDAKNYELAAEYRDMLEDLSQISSLSESSSAERDCDVVAMATHQGLISIHHLMIRKSQVDDAVGLVQLLPDPVNANDLDLLIVEYCLQQIRNGVFSKHLVLNISREFRMVLQDLIAKLSLGAYQILGKMNSEQKRWMNISKVNAESALHQYALSSSIKNLQLKYLRLYTGCQDDILTACIDVSHFQGEAMKASFVVFKNVTPLKSRYRQLSIKTVSQSNDVAAIYEAVGVFLRGWLKNFPELHVLIIDGGLAQLKSAQKQIDQSGFAVKHLVSIAKGVTRKREHETLLESVYGEMVPLQVKAELKLLFDYVRDESHRFAVRSHRYRLGKSRGYSSLLIIKGLGVARAKLLLQTFGGLKSLSQASAEDIALIKGISMRMAQSILKLLRDGG